MKRKLKIEDWYLQKEYQAAAVWNHFKNGHIQDFKEAQTSYRLVGTQEQIDEWSNKQTFILDEVYSYEPIDKDSYWDGICCGTEKTPSRKEFNNNFKKDYKEYLKLYKENKNQLLIL